MFFSKLKNKRDSNMKMGYMGRYAGNVADSGLEPYRHVKEVIRNI